MASLDTTFHDHVKEFRIRLLWVILAVSVSAIIAYIIRIRLITILLKPLNSPVYYTSPAGSFNFVLKLAFVIGVFIALPVTIYQLVRFIEPALPIRIKRGLMAKIIGSSFLLAIAGVAFGFYIMVPMSLHFFGTYATAAVKPLINANEYLSFVLNHLLTFALTFQIPMLFLFINRITPLKPSQLLRYQRHVIVAAFGLAIVLPFTYDPISQFIVAIPIVFLYYASVILLYLVNRKKPRPPELEKKFVIAAPPAPSTPMPTPSFQSLAPVTRSRLSMDGFVVTQRQRYRPLSPTPIKTSLNLPQQRPTNKTYHNRLEHPKFSIDGITPATHPSI